MRFNSIDFFFFLIIVFIIYWSINRFNLKYQNLFIVIASYVFYGWWDWRFLSLMLFSSVIDYSVGLGLLYQEKKLNRKLLLWFAVFMNLGLLFFFKYYNFFIDNFVSAFSFFGMKIHPDSLNIILPVGISFYTFQSMSYSIDVYRRKLKPTKDIVAFFAYVSFFPQLVAGPIERASDLLPQFFKKKKFNYTNAVDGMRQILWGLFKKIVIADNCGHFVREIFDNPMDYSGSSLMLGLFLLTIQVYGDFSGYSDIAIGTAKLFGFHLKQNFAFPLFSRNFQELWSRWHISLSVWFRDYVFNPLGGYRKGRKRAYINLLIVFFLIGLWHGANWTFIIFGVLNAVFIIIHLAIRKNKIKSKIIAQGKVFPTLNETRQMVQTFLLFSLSGIFFRAINIDQASIFIRRIFSPSLFSFPKIEINHADMFVFPNLFLVILILFFVFEWFGRNDKYAIEKIVLKWNGLSRYLFYYSAIFLIYLMSGQVQDFYYFQF